MTRLRRWSRPQARLNVALFLAGLALLLAPTGVEIGGVKVPLLSSWLTRGLLIAGGLALMVFSFFVTEPTASLPDGLGSRPRRGPACDRPRRVTRLVLPMVPGTPFVGYVPPLPSRFVGRADVLGALRGHVLSHATVALVGMGGAGKTVLAAAVVHDPDVQAAFPDGIAWVDAGQQATPVQLQERLAAQLTGKIVSFPSVEAGRNHLAEVIGGRAFLLVVDDVWDPRDLNALNVVGAPHGGLLFTTRAASIARAVGATTCEVDELTLEQALELLGRWTGTAFGELPPEADPLALRVGNLALGVAIAGGMVNSRGGRRQDWQDVLHLLETASVDAIREEYGPDNYRHASVLASITVSIDDLAAGERDRYRELAVFAGRGAVPPAAVSALWESPGGEDGDSRSLLTRLSDRSLLQRDPRGWISLHDLQYEVAAHQLATRPGGLAGAHGRLVDGYGRRCHSGHGGGALSAATGMGAVWAGGPDDGYFFQNLAYHLACADRSGQLDRLLVDFAWLDRKLRVAGISLLLADYTHQPRPPDVEVVHAALQLSGHVLAADPSLLAGQLVGRLLAQPGRNVRTLVDAARRWDRQPWLCPLTPGSLAEPGGPLERILEGHDDFVCAVAVTPDCQRIISAGQDKTVRVWNLASGHPERTLRGHDGWVSAVAVTPDGQRIISAGQDKTVRVWNLASGRLERTLYGHDGWVSAVAVTPDGRRIISAGSDHTVRVWNLASGHPERTLYGHQSSVIGVAVTRDGQRIISASHDKTVRVWDLASGHPEQTLKTYQMDAVAITPDGQRIVCAIGFKEMRVWNLATGHPEQTLKGHDDDVRAVAVTPDGQRIISAGSDHTVRVWNLASGRLEQTLEGHDGTVSAVAVTPDGQRIISAGYDTAVRVWDMASGHPERTLEGHHRPVYAVAVTPDGQRMISASEDETVRVWNLASGHPERTLKGDHGPVSAVAVTPDGQHIISASDKTVRVWNLASGRPERTLKGHDGWVRSVAVIPDGQHIISASDDETVRVWNLASRRPERTLYGHDGAVKAVAVTPDGQHIISASHDKTVRVWDLSVGTELAAWVTDGWDVHSCAAQPRDSSIIVYGDSSGRIVVLSICADPRGTASLRPPVRIQTPASESR